MAISSDAKMVNEEPADSPQNMPEKASRSPLVFEHSAMDMQQKDKFRVQYLKRLSAEKVWIPKEERPPQQQTVIIFDWDDTLMYSSFLMKLNGRDLSRISSSIRQQLWSIENAAYKLLDIAVGLGCTFIITNAEHGWVEMCVERYMPSLKPILKKVQVISARTAHSEQHSDDVSQWKRLAFLELGRQLDAEAVTNLVSVGDSQFEHDALHLLGKQFARRLIKTVKLQSSPTPQELMKELHVLVPKFRGLVEKAANLKTCLERKST